MSLWPRGGLSTLFAGAIGASFAFLVLLVRPLRTIESIPDEGQPPPSEDLVEPALESQSAEI